uniref:Uncharacterized protein n=1 Tax=Mastacembelus armatus TaxID=205130 RepID=A0A3Q3MH06_9TELE
MCYTNKETQGGSVMVKECFAAGPVGDLYKIQGLLNQRGYQSNLQCNAMPSGSRLALILCFLLIQNCAK